MITYRYFSVRFRTYFRQFIRSAGTFATILQKDDTHVTIKLMSTEIRKFPVECWASIGQLSNPEHNQRLLGKAGVRRWQGWRPSVRGNAMETGSHPHGGGTSAKHTKRCPVSPWGILRTGYKTRCPTKPLGMIIRRNLPGKQQKKFGGSA